jgi:hypothetical protein
VPRRVGNLLPTEPPVNNRPSVGNVYPPYDWVIRIGYGMVGNKLPTLLLNALPHFGNGLRVIFGTKNRRP